MIEYMGRPVYPSFRVERGETLDQLDLEFGYIVLMHPYDIVQHLAGNGEISKAFAALEGFLHREADIKAQQAIVRLTLMYED